MNKGSPLSMDDTIKKFNMNTAYFNRYICRRGLQETIGAVIIVACCVAMLLIAFRSVYPVLAKLQEHFNSCLDLINGKIRSCYW